MTRQPAPPTFHRRRFLRCSLFTAHLILLLVSVIACSTAAAQSPPNIIVVVVDDLRWDELGCMGHPVVKTPNIDRLAESGVRFSNAFATTPLCSPSRGCLLTGQYAFQHGIVDNTNRSERSHQLVTFPRLLHDAGYESGFVGKWHMGNDDTPRPGFDRWVCLAGQGTSADPRLNIDGKSGPTKGYTTDVLNELSVEFVKRRRTQPFCLFLAQKALHPELKQFDDGSISDPSAARFIPAERHEALYRDAKVPRRANTLDSLDGKPALQRKIAGLPPLSQQTGTDDETVRDRWRMLAAVDEGVGLLLKALAESGQLANTVFVVTSDHGYWYGEHGLSVERRLAYEEGIRIPLLISCPRLVPRGKTIDAMALTIDLAPTMLDMAGVLIPASMAGRSLVPHWQSSPPAPESWRRSFLIEYYTDTVFPRVLNMGYDAVRTERFKYIQYQSLDGMNELYDLRNDPGELRNVIAAPEYGRELRELQMELSRLKPPGRTPESQK